MVEMRGDALDDAISNLEERGWVERVDSPEKQRWTLGWKGTLLVESGAVDSEDN